MTQKPIYLKILNTEKQLNNFDINIDAKIQRLFDTQDMSKYLNYVVVYHNYQSDFTGNYDMSLALIVDSSEYDLKVDNLTKFDHDSNESVIKIWQDIWGLETDKKLIRRYEADLEIHTGDQVDVYLGLKED